MGNIFDGLETETYDRTYSDKALLKRVLSYFNKFTTQILLVVAMLIIHSILGMATPILISKTIDWVSQSYTLTTLLMLFVSILLIGLTAWITNYVRQLFSARITGEVVLSMRQDVFNATIHHDMSFYDEHPSGKIVSRITSDTQDFSDVVNQCIDLLSHIVLIIFLIIWLFTVNAYLTCLTLLMIPISIVIALSFRKIARKVTQNARRVTSKINAQIQESISGIVVAKNFRQEHTIYESFNATNKQAYQQGLRRGLVLNTIFPIMSCASGLGLASLVYFGGLSTKAGTLTPGNWYLFMQSVAHIWWPMLNIASFWSQFQDGLSAAERIFSLIDAKAKVIQTEENPIENMDGGIEFKNVAFSYSDKEKVLSNFTLNIKPQETIAFVGHTGAGKSSIAKLIARFYEFSHGDLNISGQDIRKINLESYRNHIGIVPQEPFLFSGSVADNIRYGNPSASDDQVRQSAMQIGNGKWINSLSQGLNTDVGERGGSLSMGQRQLVALARVLLKNPKIFILDEATASVDPFTETQIKEGLETIMENRTAIVIAHRLSTVKNADRIIVLECGNIIEEGTHNVLLSKQGHYAMLHNTYFRHQSLSYIENFAVNN